VRDPGPDALPIKLEALTADQCFRSPDRQIPKGCEKYVTELGNTAASVRKRAGDQDPQLVALADRLDRFVGAYRTTGCGTIGTPGSGPCTQALADMAATLGDIRAAVDRPASTG
jgi:hypothetical protein